MFYSSVLPTKLVMGYENCDHCDQRTFRANFKFRYSAREGNQQQLAQDPLHHGQSNRVILDVSAEGPQYNLYVVAL
jgi:hypothetical protein